jgi:DNA polymerase-3 subunit delta
MTPEAARALADTAPDPRPGEDLGLHLRRLDNDLAKLAAYADGASITPEDVRALVVGREATTFDLLDAVAEGRWRAAVTAYRRLLQQGETPESVVPQLAALVRRLLLVHETLREGRSLQAEARELGLSPSPRYLAKLSQQAQRFTDAALEQAYHALLACDVDVKTGRADPEVAVELVVHLLASDALSTEPDREMVVGGAYRGPW